MSTVNRSQIFTLFTLFGGDPFEGTSSSDILEAERLLDEVMIKLGQDPRAWISQVTTTNTGTSINSADDNNYELRADLNLIKLMAVFVDDRQLMREREFALPAQWRDRQGMPLAYIIDAKSDRFLRLYPRPDKTALNRTFDDPGGSPTIIYTENRSGDDPSIPAQLALPIALLTLAREFERETNHRDQDFSMICTALGDSFLKMLQQQVG